MSNPIHDTTAADVSPDTLRKYDKTGPRYTSYPTAPMWSEDFGDAEYRAALARAAAIPAEPLSLYIHIPFCRERCDFCGCNVIIGRKDGLGEKYLDYVHRELAMVAQALGGRNTLSQLHWGGGTPTHLSVDLMRQLFASITQYFTLAPNAEVALEVDPRVTTREQLETLREFGFNRISMGVQDLDATVQDAIGRNQSVEQTRTLYESARELGFTGINMDLISGLPNQTHETWTHTLEQVIAMRPDRLAVYSFAYLPGKLKNQKRMSTFPLPDLETKYDIIATARQMFLDAGYRAIGMDHYALPEDELSLALEKRKLNRNFMGYTVTQAEDMIAAGTSAIAEVGSVYAQNHKKLNRYYDAIDTGRFPVMSGCALTQDDKIRSWTIRELMCNLYLDFGELQNRFNIEYADYFAESEAALAPYYEEGFLQHSNGGIRVTPLGQVFVRNIAMEFDAYLKQGRTTQFSRTV